MLLLSHCQYFPKLLSLSNMMFLQPRLCLSETNNIYFFFPHVILSLNMSEFVWN